MQSFSDSTLSACMRTEFININNSKNNTKNGIDNISEYFKDSIQFSGILSKTRSVKRNNQINKNVTRSKNKDSKINEESIATFTNHDVEANKVQFESNHSLSNINRNEISKTTSPFTSYIDSNYVNSKSNIIEYSNCTNDRVSTQDRCKLKSWGLPPTILQKYETHGITTMFPWQIECLSRPKVLEECKNLIYSAPTSAGKTLVAEILLIKTVLERKRKVIFILPFVSVVREKMYYFQDLLSNSGIRVEGFMGGISPPGGFAATDVAIATIEKANNIINRLMEDRELNTLGMIIIDELHLIGDPHRGYLLELLLTKIKYMKKRDKNIQIQLVGMSATLPNLCLLAEWLDAELYRTDFRPVPLNEQCKIGLDIYDSELNLIRTLSPSPELPTDSENIYQLCIETISSGHSILIFCSTKNWCEKLAQQVAGVFLKLGHKDSLLGRTLRAQLNSEAISETLEQLKRSPTGLDNILKNTISFGVAFHHAGLTMDERDIIEGSFRSGSLRVLTATSTLSSGVNLPARRVLIRSPNFGGKLLDIMTYKQMIGRAGRMGKDTAGESILICKENEKCSARILLSAVLNPVTSCLEGADQLIRALLEAIASEIVFTPDDLQLYTNCTLVSLSEKDGVHKPSADAVKFLVKNEFLMLQSNDDINRWVATPLGKACLAASISPREGLLLFEELQKARRCFVLDTELHIIYLVTPINSGNQIGTIDWMTYYEIWKSISESERRVGQLMGIDERFLMLAIKGAVKQGKTLNLHKRFYTALALHDLVREVPLGTVCKKYGCCRGVLQSLQQSSATFAGMVTQFCKQLGWTCIELLVDQFQTRLQFGVCRDLLDLLRLSMLNGLRARSLFKEGFKTVMDLAVANEFDVERALYKALPFESEKEIDGENILDANKRNKMRTVFVTGREGLTPREAALLLIKEARVLVQAELGIQNIDWEQNNGSLSQSNEQNNENSITEIIYTESNTEFNNSKLDEISERNNFTDKNNTESYTNNLPQIQETVVIESLQNAVAVDCNTEKSSDRENIVELENIHNNEISRDLIVKRSHTSPLKRVIESKTNSEISNGLSKSPQNNKVEHPATKKSSENSISPLIFDDTLDLDTQLCDVLEQNIIDSLRISDFEESNISAKILTHNNLKKSITMVNCEEKTHACNKSRNSDVTMKNLASSSLFNSEVKNNVSSWIDDSWDESKQVIQKITKIDNANSKRKQIALKDTTESKILNNTKLKIYKSKSRNLNLENFKTDEGNSQTPLKRHVLRNMRENISPMVNLNIKNNRLSTESNKSDSDDFIAPSQRSTTPTNISNWTTLKSQVFKKISTKNITPKSVKKIQLTSDIKSTIKPRLKEFLPHCHLSPQECSADSIIYNSDEEKVPTKRPRLEQKKSNIYVAVEQSPFSSKVSRDKIVNDDINWNTLNIVKVASNRATFNMFKRELMKQTNISLALNCEILNNTSIGSGIGLKVVEIQNSDSKKKSRKSDTFTYENKKLSGIAISWGSNISYCMSFDNNTDIKVSVKEQIALFKEILCKPTLHISCFSVKTIFKFLYLSSKIAPTCRFFDPLVADWLLNCDNYDRNFNDMVDDYFPQGKFILKRIGSINKTAPGLDFKSKLPGDYRAAAESVLTANIMDNLLNKLEEQSSALKYTFKEIEMPIVITLARMELNGLYINVNSLRNLSSVIQEEMANLEERSYAITGKKINFVSSKEVAQILGLYKGKKISTNKAVLAQCDNVLSSIIMSWRQLKNSQTKVVFPLLKLVEQDPRIHGNCITTTVTGRVTMHEPNLQNVPKDFNSEDNSFVISIRTAFIPATGNILLSADYCQLELRILASFSKDQTLCSIMHEKGDIFRSIAAKWNNIIETEVTEDMRHRTKQLCYGMIYGMSTKTLSENLSVSEEEASEFSKKFFNTYPSIQQWINTTLIEAERNGYVTTLMGRRRYFSTLKSDKPSEKLQAERRVINTKIQGSAADIVKTAMIAIEKQLQLEFPTSSLVLPEVQNKRKLRSNKDSCIRGAYLVLQMHDELLYEVNEVDLQKAARIIQESMEQTFSISIPLPVKLKIGLTWGDLKEYNLPL